MNDVTLLPTTSPESTPSIASLSMSPSYYDDEPMSNSSFSTQSSSMRLNYPKDVLFLRDGPVVFFFAGTLIISILGTVLNFLAILVLTHSSRRRRSDASTKFVLNLAFADLLFCSFTIPSHWFQTWLRADEFWGEFLCDVNQLSFFWTFQLSLYTLSCVSLNRMVKICHHDVYSRIFSKNRVRCIILCCWIVSLSLSMLPIFSLYGDYQIFQRTKRSGKYYCGVTEMSQYILSPVAFFYTIGFLVPFISIVFSYVKIYLEVQKHRSNFLKSSISNAQSYKLFQTILMIFAGFILCYFPNLILRGWTPYTPKYPYLRQVVKLLLYFNACLNPIIYFTMNQEYRNDFFNYINRVFRGESIQSVFMSVRNQTSASREGRHTSRGNGVPSPVPVDSAVFIAKDTHEICVSPAEKEKISSDEEATGSVSESGRSAISKQNSLNSPNLVTPVQKNDSFRKATHASSALQLNHHQQTQQRLHRTVSGKHFITVGVVLLSILVVIAFILDCLRHRHITEHEWTMRAKEMLDSQFLDKLSDESAADESWNETGELTL